MAERIIEESHEYRVHIEIPQGAVLQLAGVVLAQLAQLPEVQQLLAQSIRQRPNERQVNYAER